MPACMPARVPACMPTCLPFTLYPSSAKDWPGGQQKQEHGLVLHDPGEDYQKPTTLRSGSSQVFYWLSMRCPKSRFPIRIIVFDELKLIFFVNQGLSLLTASLVGLLHTTLNSLSYSAAKCRSQTNDQRFQNLFSEMNANLQKYIHFIPPAGAAPGSKSLWSWLPEDRHSSAPPALCPPRQVW